MPGKKVQCMYCSKVMRSDNLKNHVKIHKKKSFNDQPIVAVGQSLVTTGSKRTLPLDIPTFNDDTRCPVKMPVDVGLENEPKNIKIQALLEEIINDTPPIEAQTFIAPKKILPIVSQKEVLSKLSQQAIAELFPSKQSSPHKVVAELLPLSARTKGDIMGYSDGESSEEESSDDDDESSTESEDSIDISNVKPPKVKILPATVEGLQQRFKKLFCEFIRKKKHENRNELVFILDELLRQEAISQETYTQVNNLLAGSLGDDGSEEMDVDADDTSGNEESEEDVVTNLVQSTTADIILHDKKELVELLKEMKEEVGEEYIDTVLQLEELISAFFTDAYLEGNLILPMINELRTAIESSSISKVKQHRLKMLLDDINNNRYRVRSILTRLSNSQDDIKTIAKVLAREELLSKEQFEKLAELEDLDLPAVALIIKDTKIGRGLKLLPRKINDLVQSLQTLLTELAEAGSSTIQSNVRSVLEELLQRKGITQERYNTIKDEHNIL